MPQLSSPRLPGVPVLRSDANGPEYTRWRRGVKEAFLAKGTWGFCNGTNLMPMPDAGPNFFTPSSSPVTVQPSLLEERRAWVKKDRDVKLDIFLSVADDIKLEVFEVGPPLPPSAMTAKEMLEALDQRYDSFRFEDYHHVFCHFLNLHIDQYSNIDDFNAEYQATLEDLLDHGHPMSNVQACSAYFSKLRCTQNPWVAKQLKEWDTHSEEVQLATLMEQSPPWSIIRPLNAALKTALPPTAPPSVPEETAEDTPAQSDGEYSPSEHSEVDTVSSKASHSRGSSRSTQNSQEIVVHASYEDLTEAFPYVPVTVLPSSEIPKRASSIAKFAALQALPTPANRPLPPLPASTDTMGSSLPRSTSSKSSGVLTPPKSSLDLTTASHSSSPMSLKGMELTHPALHPSIPTPVESAMRTETAQANLHPALRIASPATPLAVTPLSTDGHISSAMRPRTPTPPLTHPTFGASSPNLTKLAVPPAAIADQRPQSARSTTNSSSPWSRSLLRIESNNSSIISLPLQGAVVPEFHDTLITEMLPAPPPPPPPHHKREDAKRQVANRLELARARFEGITGSPPRHAGLLAVVGEEERKQRKRSWSIKARLSAKHGIKEII